MVMIRAAIAEKANSIVEKIIYFLETTCLYYNRRVYFLKICPGRITGAGASNENLFTNLCSCRSYLVFHRGYCLFQLWVLIIL